MADRQVYVSPQAKAMIGYGDHELRNGLDVWKELVHPEDRLQLTRALKRHLRRETPVFECEHRMLGKDGDYRWILARGAALFDDRGRPQRMLGAFIDVTLRHQAEEQVIANLARERELTELKARFVAMASHELRTPLATFSLGVELLRKHWPTLSPERIEKKFPDGHRQHPAPARDHGRPSVGRPERGRAAAVPAGPVELAGFCRRLADEVKAASHAPHAIEWEFSRRNGTCGSIPNCSGTS